jgi:hypothetical protein
MRDRVHLTTWLDRTSKARFGGIAQSRGLSESALLRQLVESTLTATDTAHASTLEPVLPVASSGRISVRLRSDDLLLLRERAIARELPTSGDTLLDAVQIVEEMIADLLKSYPGAELTLRPKDAAPDNPQTEGPAP